MFRRAELKRRSEAHAIEIDPRSISAARPISSFDAHAQRLVDDADEITGNGAVWDIVLYEGHIGIVPDRRQMMRGVP
ncbi:MAG: hypothetical protein ACLTSX_02650 [Collinsella sp.]